MHRQNLVAHRGIPTHFAGNSIHGLHSVLELGIHYLEFDIQISRDGVPILFHDANLKQETGVNARVEDLTWGELKNINFKKKNGYQTYPLTSLANAIKLIEQYPQCTIFAEVKRAAILKFGIADTSSIIFNTIAPVHKRTIPISIHKGFLKHVREQWRCPIGWICETWGEYNQKQAKILKPDYLFANMDNLSQTQTLTPAPWMWALYETSDPVVGKKWLECGVTLIESNDVLAMIDGP
jgi:glycerophosphoryl diester phosphodiesterase